MNRRNFLIQSSCIMTAVVQPALALPSQQWDTLAAVQAHLFPASPDAPGAQDINATGYLHFILAYEPVDREFIEKGVIYLDKIGQYTTGKPFLDLSTPQRELLLRRFEMGEKGQRWLKMILQYILEALLTDPIYGGNPNEIGWKWLEHQSGFPKPPLNKRYFML
ncbi:MAG: gluconate 2-dehydrogenase subunit 3 family protein [Thiomargarita sp.]|nr:gluconate 2-dehydrogenase subunit 3 family protein [Thiomargarita sp.]